MSRRHPVPPDIALWDEVKKSVRPLRPAPVHRSPEPMPRPLDGPALMAPARPVDSPPPARNRAPPPIVPLEKGLLRKVRRGAEPVADRLDLHGMRQEEAHRHLLSFLRDAQARGARLVLVITGKGGAPGAASADALAERGVLRRAVPTWLRLPEFRTLVVGFEPALLRHGGAGALYVHVRRLRDEAAR